MFEKGTSEKVVHPAPHLDGTQNTLYPVNTTAYFLPRRPRPLRAHLWPPMEACDASDSQLNGLSTTI